MRFFILAVALFATAAHADFKFKCRKGDTKKTCIQEFEEVAATCCVTAEGKPDTAVTNPAEFCQIDKDATTCKVSTFDGLWSCDMKSARCQGTVEHPGIFDPLKATAKHSCKDGESHTLVFAPESGRDFFGIKREGVRPMFCVSKANPVTQEEKITQ